VFGGLCSYVFYYLSAVQQGYLVVVARFVDVRLPWVRDSDDGVGEGFTFHV
jgi:hypothetical protein